MHLTSCSAALYRAALERQRKEDAVNGQVVPVVRFIRVFVHTRDVPVQASRANQFCLAMILLLLSTELS